MVDPESVVTIPSGLVPAVAGDCAIAEASPPATSAIATIA
jgi:hypothetical protein